MEQRLKNCPFCGGAAEIKRNSWYEEINGKWEWVPKSYYVKCAGSRCMMICISITTKSQEEAIEVWNRRVSDG